MTAFSDIVNFVLLAFTIGLVAMGITRVSIARFRKPAFGRLRVEAFGFASSFLGFDLLAYGFAFPEAFYLGTDAAALFASVMASTIISGIIAGWAWGKVANWIGRNVGGSIPSTAS
ncbi:MAG TPA: hypothetical protein VFE96_03330 [Candidatus Bathyarchaeia archaeon]|jgi:hypothetical protein|nr:hypothetical protein [Candidatus Bathyarchaeia archaeon]